MAYLYSIQHCFDDTGDRCHIFFVLQVNAIQHHLVSPTDEVGQTLVYTVMAGRQRGTVERVLGEGKSRTKQWRKAKKRRRRKRKVEDGSDKKKIMCRGWEKVQKPEEQKGKWFKTTEGGGKKAMGLACVRQEVRKTKSYKNTWHTSIYHLQN